MMDIGNQVMEQIVTFGDRTGQRPEPVTLETFAQWKESFTFEGLRGLRYGQSFCNHFGISDNLLYYTQWPIEQQDDYIQRYYVR
jgi:hypothetical protein